MASSAAAARALEAVRRWTCDVRKLFDALPRELRTDRTFLLQLIAAHDKRASHNVFFYLPRELKNDKEFAMEALSANPTIFRYLSGNLRGKFDLAYRAVQLEPENFAICANNITENLIIAGWAIFQRSYLYECVGPALKNNFNFAADFIQIAPDYYWMIAADESNHPLQNDRKLAELAIDGYYENYTHASDVLTRPLNEDGSVNSAAVPLALRVILSNSLMQEDDVKVDDIDYVYDNIEEALKSNETIVKAYVIACLIKHDRLNLLAGDRQRARMDAIIQEQLQRIRARIDSNPDIDALLQSAAGYAMTILLQPQRKESLINKLRRGDGSSALDSLSTLALDAIRGNQVDPRVAEMVRYKNGLAPLLDLCL